MTREVIRALPFLVADISAGSDTVSNLLLQITIRGHRETTSAPLNKSYTSIVNQHGLVQVASLSGEEGSHIPAGNTPVYSCACLSVAVHGYTVDRSTWRGLSCSFNCARACWSSRRDACAEELRPRQSAGSPAGLAVHNTEQG